MTTDYKAVLAPVYALEAGRCITRDGKPFCTLHGCGNNYDPTELDALARRIVGLLEPDRATEEEIRRARRDYRHDDDLEVDDNAIASRGEDGVWVQAWVWLANEQEAA